MDFDLVDVISPGGIFDVRLPMEYRGAAIFTLPGIYVPSISIPSGGLTRVTKVRTAGNKRMASLIEPFR